MKKSCLFFLLMFQFAAWMNVSAVRAIALNTPLSNTTISFLGAQNYKYTGWATSAGDVDGDGINDLLIGGGRVYLILGKNIGLKTGTTIEDFADASFIAENEGDSFGDAVCMAGDVNNDGFNDILIGANRYDSMRGKTYLILGKASGWSMNTPITTAAAATFAGKNTNDWSSTAIAFAGDINNDGFDDFIIGAYMVDVNGLINAGETYLFLGKTGGWSGAHSVADANATFTGENTSDGSGQRVAAAGDVNNDGFADFLISATSGNGGRGEIYLILGAGSGWTGSISLGNVAASFYGENVGDFAGNSVGSAGDVNHDGFDDLLIGASESDYSADRAGKAYLILGKASGWAMNTNLSTADASFYGEQAADFAGSSVSSAGDVNNDGFDDFLIGAVWANEFTGKAYLIYGKASGWATNVSIGTADGSFLGESTYDYAGFSLTAAGDLNQDGNDDFLISAAYFGPTYTGKVYLLYSDAPVLGDLNGDGTINLADVIIGLQAVSGKPITQFGSRADINGDGKVGMAEVLSVLRKVAGSH
jgi:hypothetical protein